MSSAPPAGISVTVRGIDYEFSTDRRVRIGRDPSNDVEIDNPHVSRQHALLFMQGDDWVLESVSPSGLHHNGSDVSRLVISAGSEVWLAPPPNGERIELSPVSGVSATTRLAAPRDGGTATVVAPGTAVGGGAPPTALAPGGPLQRSGGGIRVRLNGREYTFAAGQAVTIGRLPTSDVQAQSDFVSREHATLRFDRGTWVFESRGQHGTFIGGTAVTTLSLAGPTSVRLGDAQQGDVLELLPDGTATPTQVPPRAAQAPVAAPAAAAGVPGGAFAPNRVTGNTSVIRRLTTTNRRTALFAGIAAAVALIVGAVSIWFAFNGGDDIEGVIADGSPKTALVNVTFINGKVGNGTGWVWNAESGLFVTNEHVVRDSDSVEVGILDRLRPADVLATAPCEDLAVVQVSDTAGLEAFGIGSSEELAPGQPVVSLGYGRNASPQDDLQGRSGNVTLADTNAAPEGYETLIQHTATISPGNSGGPLVNLDGELVGVNTLATASIEQSNQFYAVPSERVNQIVPTIESGNSLGYDGIGPDSFKFLESPSLGLPENILLVETVDPNSPAAREGITGPQDVGGGFTRWLAITAIDGTPLATAGDYCDAIRDKRPGDSATYRVLPLDFRGDKLSNKLPGKAVTLTF